MPELRRRALIRCCSRLLVLFGLTVALLPATGCTENDELLVDDIGVTRLLLIDTGLLGQSISTTPFVVQAIEWKLSEARLDIDGALVDLLAGDTQCDVIDSVDVDPFTTDLCAQGIVIESSDEDDPFDLKLFLTFEQIEAHRAITPNYLDKNDPTYREDGDDLETAGLPGSIFENLCTDTTGTDCRDNCPEIINPDQELPDGASSGPGKACATASGIRDTDDDGVVDGFDNCVYISNPDQDDTMGFGAIGVPDGIGDACEVGSSALGSQVISISLTGGPQLAFEDFALVQPQNFPSFIVVDFNSQVTLASCDLQSGNCDMNSDEIRVCTTSNPFEALQGCFTP